MSSRGRYARRFAVATVALLGALSAFASIAGANAGEPGKQVSFVGFVQGLVTPVFAPGFPFVRDTFGGRCSVPSDYMTFWSGVGQSNHTGLITATGSDCDRIDLATGSVVYGDGVIDEHGANGDFIYGTYTNGHGTLGGEIADEWTIVGGTGLFAGATGHGVEQFILLAPPSFTGAPIPFINPWQGTIAYDASNRADG
jgi:hypothetical protein